MALFGETSVGTNSVDPEMQAGKASQFEKRVVRISSCKSMGFSKSVAQRVINSKGTLIIQKGQSLSV